MRWGCAVSPNLPGCQQGGTAGTGLCKAGCWRGQRPAGDRVRTQEWMLRVAAWGQQGHCAQGTTGCNTTYIPALMAVQGAECQQYGEMIRCCPRAARGSVSSTHGTGNAGTRDKPPKSGMCLSSCTCRAGCKWVQHAKTLGLCTSPTPSSAPVSQRRGRGTASHRAQL